MKITLANGTVLEMDDAPTPKQEAKAPATTTAPAKPKQVDAAPEPVATEPKPAQPAVVKRDAAPQAARVEAQPKAPPVAEPKEPPAASSNPLRSFDVIGGVNDISDPSRGNPNVFKFEPPKEELWPK
jgi:hypothetical protein